MNTMAIPVPASIARHSNERWRHLILCVVCMIMIANLQYGWTLLAPSGA